MNAADIELARMAYLASALGVLLFTSLLLRGLWRPLRFVLLAMAFSVMFTPFFIPDQPMPDGSQQNVVPAFVVMLHDAASDRAQWKSNIKRAGKPILAVMAITSVIALLLAFLLPKPARPSANPASDGSTRPARKPSRQHNPYLPEDFQPR